MGKRWRTNSWILKNIYVELMGTTERGGWKDSFEMKEERTTTKWTVKNDRWVTIGHTDK